MRTSSPRFGAIHRLAPRNDAREQGGSIVPTTNSSLREQNLKANLSLYELAVDTASPRQIPLELLTLAENTPDFVAAADVQGKILYLNPAARQMLGLDPHASVAPLELADLHPVWASVLVLGDGIEMALLDGS